MTHANRKNAKRTLSLSSALSRFQTDQRGNAIILVGFAMGIVVMSAGAAIDISQRSMAKEELSAAVDTAALAACRAWKLSSTNAETASVKTAQTAEANQYVSANFNQQRYSADAPKVEVTFPVVSNSNTPGSFQDKIKVKVSASTTVPTTLMRVVGTENLPISATSECSRAQGGIELTMVLDNTGSMGSSLGGVTKITALRNATGKMLDMIYGSAETSNLVRVNIIPYAVSVNVGRLLEANDLQADPNEPGYNQGNLEPFDPLNPSSSSISNSKWYGCIVERDTDNGIGLTAGGSAATLDKDLTTPAHAFDMSDVPVNTNVTSTINGTTKNSGRWAPFIQKYNTGQTRASHSVYNWDNSQGKYVQGTGTGSDGGSGAKNRGACSAPTVTWKQGLTRTQLKNLVVSANYMIPDGNTYSDVGMAWALRMTSPGAPFPSDIKYEDRYDTNTSNPFAGWVKGILMMTDGVISASDPVSRDYNQSPFTAYGFSQVGTALKDYNQALPSSASSNTLDNLNNSIRGKLDTAHEQRLLMACKGARKPAGWDVASNPNRDNDAIRVYTVFFGSTSELAAKAQLYKDCAGKDGFFINAQNETQLNSAFSQIASDLQNLRLSL
jgi:Flp pilus assembly protein TadG